MIKKIEDKKFYVRIQPRDTITGKRINWPSAYAKSKTEAKKIEKQMWNEYKAGLNLGDGNAVFAEVFQKYVNQRANRISPVTLKSWQESANSFSEYFKKAKVSQITTTLVSNYAHDYVNQHNATVSKSSTIAKRLIHMRNFFKSIEGKSIKENPVPEGALRQFFQRSDFSIPQEWRIFSKKELKRIQNLIKEDLQRTPVNNWGSKLAILIESYTGMRIGELQAIRFEDLVSEDGIQTLEIHDSWSDYSDGLTGSLKARPKGATRTLLPLPEDVVRLIEEYKTKQNEFLNRYNLFNPLGLIFINLHDYRSVAQDRPISQKGFNAMLRQICTRLNIKADNKKMSMYSFRHTICTHLANTPGMSYTWASERMGHSLQMFMHTYVGIDPSINREMNKLWMN